MRLLRIAGIRDFHENWDAGHSRNCGAIKRRRSTSQLVQNHQRSISGVVEDRGRFLETNRMTVSLNQNVMMTQQSNSGALKTKA
jgi:hypothetical protein